MSTVISQDNLDRLRSYTKSALKAASNIYPAALQVPMSDPIQILAEMVADTAVAIDAKLDELPVSISRQMPHLFGLTPQEAQPAFGHLLFEASSQVTDSFSLLKGTTLTTLGTTPVRYSILEDVTIHPGASVTFEQKGSEIVIGIKGVDLQSDLVLFFDLEAKGEEIIEWFGLKGSQWIRINAIDQSNGLSRSGSIAFLMEGLLEPSLLNGESSIWIKGITGNGNSASSVRSIYPNVSAVHNVTIHEKFCLGSGEGLPNQRFKLPPGFLINEMSLFTYAPDGTTTQWREVQSLDLCNELHDAYLFDAVTSEVVFGDGINGRIAPRGFDNIWVKNLCLSDGQKGNQPPSTALILEKHDWRIQSVTLLGGLEGGTDPSTDHDLLHHLHVLLRSSDRAITLEDFRDFAILASARIGAAFAYKNSSDSVEVSILLKPQYSLESQKLDFSPASIDLATVEEYLRKRTLPGLRLVVTGPKYRDLTVRVKAVVSTQASIAKTVIAQAIQDFLSPYSKNSDPVKPGTTISKKLLLDVLESVIGVEVVKSVYLEDALSGVTSSLIYLGESELPRIRLELELEEGNS